MITLLPSGVSPQVGLNIQRVPNGLSFMWVWVELQDVKVYGHEIWVPCARKRSWWYICIQFRKSPFIICKKHSADILHIAQLDIQNGPSY